MNLPHRVHQVKIGVLASGGGSNLQAILDRIREGSLNAEVVVVIGNNSRTGSLTRARDQGIPGVHLSSLKYPHPEDLDRAILGTAREHGVEMLVLAGYLRRLGPGTLSAYADRILNIHPALLPSFGGEGMYGRRVHEAVIASGAKLTGVTVHLVDEAYDRGPIVAQRAVPVEDDDTPETLGSRVLAVEHSLYPEVLGWFAQGKVRVVGKRVFVDKS